MNTPEQLVAVRLPRCVEKRDLKDYFDVSYKYLWSELLTDELFDEWGYDRDDWKRAKRFPPNVTLLIYSHFNISNLDTTLADELGVARPGHQVTDTE